MGEAGIVTRVLAHRFGSAWSYAGALRDVGQLTVDDLVNRYQFRTLSPATRLYGVVGRPVSHSVSPAMHNAAIRATGIDATYLPLAAVDADDFFTFAEVVGIAGASVTIPFKVAMLERIDDVDPLARRVGALNTIRFGDERFAHLGGSGAASETRPQGRAHVPSTATNTDISGFLRPLADRGIEIRGKRASILGAGGSARAVAIALADEGARVRVHGRRAAQAEAVADVVDGEVGPWPPNRGSWDLLVNCTPIGMYPHAGTSPMPHGALDGAAVYDLVYNPQTTQLLRDAAAAGCATIGGLDMLVAQAREQFRWWTGIEPPTDVMRAAAIERLGEFTTDEDHLV
jgi:shikimate 5-dehydrogenase